MVNSQWSWRHSHKSIVSDARLCLLSTYRELVWKDHRKWVLDNKDLTEQEYAGLFKELLWFFEEESLQHTDNYKKAVKYEKYMRKHRRDL